MADFDDRTLAKWHGLREWRWSRDTAVACHLLYDGAERLVAHIALVDGVWKLWLPVTWPRKSWLDPESAKRGAELIALSALPPDKSMVRALERSNNPMKPPLSRPWPQETSSNFIIVDSKVAADPGPLPAFLRRAAVEEKSERSIGRTDKRVRQ